MGFYNNVAFTIYKKDACDLLRRTRSYYPIAYELLCSMKLYDHGDAVSFVGEPIRWDENIFSVNLIMSHLEDLDNCSFRQVGEDFMVKDYWDNGDDLLEYVQLDFSFEIANDDAPTTCDELLRSYNPEPIKEPQLDANALFNKIKAAEALINEIKITAEDFSDVPEGRDVKSQCITVDGGLKFLKRCICYLGDAISEEYPEE